MKFSIHRTRLVGCSCSQITLESHCHLSDLLGAPTPPPVDHVACAGPLARHGKAAGSVQSERSLVVLVDLKHESGCARRRHQLGHQPLTHPRPPGRRSNDQVGHLTAARGDDEAYDVVPDDQLTVIDYLVGYQLVQEIEPNLQPLFNGDYSAVRLIVATSNLSNVELLNFADKIDAWAKANVSPNFAITRGDNSILYARISETISYELLRGFSLSFLLITLTMIVGLRSLKYGLLSIIPNIFPATIVFGFWGLLQGNLSPHTLMLFSISIGLVVDDSVHILSKYISAKRDGASSREAVRYSIDKAGSAITITTLSLAVGTFLLVFSSTTIFQNVALLITPIIVTALFLDLLFLLPLLMRFDAWIDGKVHSRDTASA